MKKDLLFEATAIAEAMDSAVIGIGHAVLAILSEKDANKTLLEAFGEDVIKNKYLETYVRQLYSKENVSPTKNRLTPFMRELAKIIEEEMEAGGKFNDRVITKLATSDAFYTFAENFENWMNDNNFNASIKLNVKTSEIDKKLSKLNYVTNLNSRVEETNPTIIGRDEELLNLTEILLKKNKCNAVLVGDAGVGKTAIVEKLAQQINSGNVEDSLKDKVIIELNVSGLLAGTKYRGEFEDKLNKLIDIVKQEPRIILFIDEFHTVMGAGASEEAASMDASNILKPALARGEIKVIGATTYDEYRKCVLKDKAFERRFEKIDVKEPSIEETKKILSGIVKGLEKFHNVKIEKSTISHTLDLCTKYMANRYFPDKAIDILDTACVVTKIKNQKKVTDDIVTAVMEKKTNVKILKTKGSFMLKKKLREVIKGQEEAINEVTDSLELIDLGIVDHTKPLATFMFTGPTGVGKTELAKQIARLYFGSDAKMIRLDMGEYSSDADTSKLFGSAPGYVGYNEPSQLLDGVMKQPYSVVLLDEIEKAHPKIMNALLQMLDDGFMTSSTGNRVDFRNTIVIMTSNVGFHQTDSKPITLGTVVKAENKKVDLALKSTFSPEFLNRIDKVIYFNPLNKDVIKEIAENYIKEFGDYVLTDTDMDILVEEAHVEEQGARAIRRIVRTKILPRKIKKASTII